MTQTNTDYLFQFTRPAADRNVSAAPANDGDDRFGNHLSQASANSRDESAVTNRSTRGAKSTTDSAREAARHSNRVDGTRDAARTQSTEKTKQRPSKPTDHSKPASAANDKHDSPDKVESNNDDKDDSGSTRPPKYGTVEQVVATNSPAPENCSCSTADIVTAAATNVAVENPIENGAVNNGQSSNTQTAESVAPAAQISTPDTSTTIVDAVPVETVTSTEVAAAATEAVETQLPPATPKQTADDNKTDGADTANENDGATTNAQQIAAAASLEDETDPAAGAAQISADQTAATASLPKSEQPKLPSINDESSKDDSHQDSQPDAKHEAVAQPNKPTIVPVANVAATTAGDSVAAVKSNDEKKDTSVKPVTSKTDAPTVAFTRLTRPGAGVNRGEQSANGELPPIDPARFVSRVAKAFQTAHDRGSTLQIRLSPPELGSLRLEMTVKDGVLSANLQTENANARRLLLDHLPALRDRLAEQNIRVDRFDVDVRRDGTGGQADARGSQQQAFQHQPDQPAPRRQPTPPLQPRNVVRTETTPVAPTISDTGLNLIV